VYVFPGVGLGVVAVEARVVSDEMLTAAATEIGRLAAENADGGILPPVTKSRDIARHVAVAVARTAVHQGLAAPMTDGEIATRIDEVAWSPVYRELHA
jgi:malate dehydrogenase (oxaloacetate-decarboxylating)